MIREIAYSITLLFLAGLSAEDIRTKELSVYKVILFICSGFLFRLSEGKFTWYETGLCLFPGGFLILLSFLTKESIGYGDGMTVAALGLWDGLQYLQYGLELHCQEFGVVFACLEEKRRKQFLFFPFYY